MGPHLEGKRLQWWIKGLCDRIEDHNATKGNRYIGVPTMTTAGYLDEPFLILESNQQLKAINALIGAKVSPDADEPAPDLDDRIEYGFSDEYCICSDCLDLIRTSPDSYSWVPDFIVGDGFINCSECIKADPDSVIDEFKNEGKALPDCIEPGNDWRKLDRIFESGFHPGQNDDPAAVVKILQALKPAIDSVMTAESSQFYTRWWVWVPKQDAKRARVALEDYNP